ncbi:phosphoserine phosphatase SerB [Shewanella salipaludis]|uniref:Phosphoserine phosphatase n=1 Tax=Shewanella salipaludis TaxID=2723052 RepID=A0A972JNW1_9GAMM|nr:phosphoserine phosphatase SerB [Shewanella salipaludis]NMH66561.1 phosphoserine phosphatase SerB [Shewanella salipaludis]
MDKPSQAALFVWLREQASSACAFQGRIIGRYPEADSAGTAHSFRLIYRDLEAEPGLADWLARLECDFSMARLLRGCGLYGAEISLAQPLSQAQRLAFPGHLGAELFIPSGALAQLNKPGLLVMDMDSTAIEIECIDELAAMAGVGEAVAAVTERAMQGELDFEQSLRQRVAQLAGADAGIIDRLCADLPLMPGLREMVAELKSHGWRLVLASGGFTPFVSHLQQLLQLDAAFANELVIEQGKLRGEVRGRVVDAQFKADVVSSSAERWQIAEGQRLAIGDGANDIPMVTAADFGIAFHAKPKLAAAADAGIERLDLRVLPYLLRLG